jgi:hypothetical protein
LDNVPLAFRIEAIFAWGDIDCNIVEHVWPPLGFINGGRENDVQSCDERYEKGGNAGHLEYIVDGGKRPVILPRKQQMYEQYRNESQYDASEQNLDGQGTCELRAVVEDGIGIIAGPGNSETE